MELGGIVGSTSFKWMDYNLECDIGALALRTIRPAFIVTSHRRHVDPDALLSLPPGCEFEL